MVRVLEVVALLGSAVVALLLAKYVADVLVPKLKSKLSSDELFPYALMPAVPLVIVALFFSGPNFVGHISDFSFGYKKPPVIRHPDKGVKNPPAVWTRSPDEKVISVEAWQKASTLVDTGINNLKQGSLAFDVPPEMEQGKPERIEVRISGSPVDSIEKQLKDNLRDTTEVDRIAVAPYMTVVLNPNEENTFFVKPLTQDKQYLNTSGFTTWAWEVTPLDYGNHDLILSVGTRLKLPGREEETQFVPLYEKKVDVKIDRVYQSERFISEHWEKLTWIAATIAIPIIGYLWVNRKKNPTGTVLKP